MQTQNENLSLKQAVRLAKSGEKKAAARLLAEILKTNPNDANAWLWLSGCLDEPERHAFCLQQVLRIQPDNRAARLGLEKLEVMKRQPETSQSQAETAAEIEPVETRADVAAEAEPEAVYAPQPVARAEMEETQPYLPIQQRLPVTGALVFQVPLLKEQTLRSPAIARSTAPTVQIVGTKEVPPVQTAPQAKDQDRKELRNRVLRLAAGILLAAVLVLVILQINRAAGADGRPFSLPGSRLASADIRVGPGGNLAEAVQNAPEGGVVVLQAGNYELNETLVITRAVELRGAGMDATQIRSAAPGAVIHISGQANVRLAGLEILREGEQAGDVVLAESGALQMEDCRLNGARLDPAAGGGGRGLAFEQGASGGVSRSEMLDNELAGISIAGGEVTVRQNAVHNNGQYGILVSGSAAPKLEENQVNGNGQAGIALVDQAKGTLRENHLEQNGASGILMDGYAVPTAYSNTSQGNTQFGIEVRGQAAPVLISNVVQRNGKAGMGYFGGAGGAAEKNDCSQNELHGISVNESAAPFLKENHCTGNRQVGIDYWGSSGGTASNNECSQNGLQGIAVHENAQPALQNNICKGNSDSGIIYWGNSAGSASNNECSENQINGISVHDQARPLLVNNTLRQNLGSGIAFYEQAGGEARENECVSNGTDAIARPEGSSAVFNNNRCGTP